MTDANALREVLALVRAMEAQTYRAQAQALIAQGARYVTDAAQTLARSQFSPTARLNFRARVSGMLTRTAHLVADLGWQAGGGEAGKVPREITREYLLKQQEHLTRWFAQIKQSSAIPGGELRARMYAESLMGLYRQAWEAAQRAITGLPQLPAEPRDGTTDCLMFCRCHWEIKKVSPAEYHAFWRLTPAEHCDNCLCRAVVWNPLKITKVPATTPGAVEGWLMTPSGAGNTCPLYR